MFLPDIRDMYHNNHNRRQHFKCLNYIAEELLIMTLRVNNSTLLDKYHSEDLKLRFP